MPRTASFSLQTNKLNPSPGEEFIISIFINPENQETNTIFTRITYPQTKLKFIESSFSDSAYPNIVERKTSFNQIKLTSFTTSHYSKNHGLFTNLKFQAISTGETAITIEPVSKIHSSDGKGTNLVDPSKLPTSLTLFIGETQKPVLIQGKTSAPAVKSNQQIQSSNPINTFPEKGVTDYSSLIGAPKTLPPEKPKTFFSSIAGFYWFVIPLALMLILSLVVRF